VYHFVHSLITDGPKFGKRRRSAEEFGPMFSSATCEYCLCGILHSPLMLTWSHYTYY